MAKEPAPIWGDEEKLLARYREECPEIDEFDLTDKEKVELIRTIARLAEDVLSRKYGLTKSQVPKSKGSV